MKSYLSLAFFLALTLLVRCYNHTDVFVEGQTYFIDGDCYSRMTRVQKVMQHPFTIIRHQNFENYPQGVNSHATAPFDYLIAGIAVVLKPFTANYIDIAGAFVSPLLGAGMVIFLWYWAGFLGTPLRSMLLLMFSISPIIVHGTLLGRPDHQSIEMFFITIGLGAEWCVSQKPSRGWAIVSGAAWGMALWVSLYEPLILLLVIAGLYAVFDRKNLAAKERRIGYGVFCGTLLLALLVQGWTIASPGKDLLAYFSRWEKTIGEMTPVSPFSSTFYRWVGLGLIITPVLLVVRFKTDRRALSVLLLLLVTGGLTVWQARWGYFFAIIFVMSLPVQFAVFRKTWMAWGILILGIWPLLQEWDDRLFPNEISQGRIYEQRKDALYLRDAANRLKGSELAPILAPWWFSPAVAYWSGQPAVAGSSHESLPGIIDTSRFYVTADAEEAWKILRDRKVKYVIAYDPERVLATSAVLLDKPTSEGSMGEILYTHPHSVPRFLKLVYDNYTFKIFAVNQEENHGE